jgi:glutamyl-tRNA synthetase
LYEYLFAKSHGGAFVLRIEDTDRARFMPGSIENLCQALTTFGLRWDEGPEVGGPYAPYIQSQRVETGIYRKYAEQLVSQGNAYYCFCPPQTKEQIKQSHDKKEVILRDPCRDLSKKEIAGHLQRSERPAIRLRVPDADTVTYHDFVINKDISWNTKFVDEVMLLKSDGFPTYQLAVVVDDVTMKISHIIRAHEWLPSTPVQLLLFRYLNFVQPQIGHVTDILDPDGGKLSKRKGNVSCEDFLAQGYLPEAILNFILLCGWAPKDNRELYTLPEMVTHFKEGSFQVANAVFNSKKLDWFNGHYIRQKSDSDLTEALKTFVPSQATSKELLRIVPLIKDRIVKLADLNALAGFFWTKPAVNKDLFQDVNSLQHLKLAAKVLKGIDNWTVETLNTALQPIPPSNSWKTGDFFMTLRIAATGSRFTPPLSESMEILGEAETLSRLQSAIRLFKN